MNYLKLSRFTFSFLFVLIAGCKKESAPAMLEIVKPQEETSTSKNSSAETLISQMSYLQPTGTPGSYRCTYQGAILNFTDVSILPWWSEGEKFQAKILDHEGNYVLSSPYHAFAVASTVLPGMPGTHINQVSLAEYRAAFDAYEAARMDYDATNDNLPYPYLTNYAVPTSSTQKIVKGVLIRTSYSPSTYAVAGPGYKINVPVW